MKTYRIIKRDLANEAFSGVGAEKYGGRFNSPGLRAVYVSESIPLAMLELLAHAGRHDRLLGFVLFWVDIPDECIEDSIETGLPESWNFLPVGLASQSFGDRWIEEARSAALKVPSILVPLESNLILNPVHDDFFKISFSEPEPIDFDPRLTRSRDSNCRESG